MLQDLNTKPVWSWLRTDESNIIDGVAFLTACASQFDPVAVVRDGSCWRLKSVNGQMAKPCLTLRQIAWAIVMVSMYVPQTLQV